MKYTKEQIIEKYGHIEIPFKSYYKYVFTFILETDVLRIRIGLGGCASDIYREEVEKDSTLKLANLDFIDSATVEENNEVVFEKYND